MTIDNNLNAMIASELQVSQMASNVAQVANIVGDPQIQEVTADLIDSIVGQIPEVISSACTDKHTKWIVNVVLLGVTSVSF